jgi:TonB family protein
MKRICSVAVLCLLTCVLVHAQTPVPVGPDMTPPHIVNYSLPDLSPIARAAHIDGTVVVQVIVSEKGSVSEAHVLSGPAMLQQSALDAARRYTFTPALLHGKPVAVRMEIQMKFNLNSGSYDAKGWGKFQRALKKCQEQVKKPGTPSDQVEACGNAAQLADALPDDAPSFEPITAHVQYATALIRDGKAADAVPAGNKAIEMSKKHSETPLTLCASYEVTGEASALSGNLQAADKYLSQAEDCREQELQTSTTAPLKQHDSQVMKGLLEFHAKVLAAMGNQKEAALKLSHAAKL